MWIYLDHDNRIMAYNNTCSMEGNSGWVFFDGELPQNYSDYLLVGDELVYDPMPEPEVPVPEASPEVAELLAILGGEVE